jgi:hypothetical protein
MDHAIAGTGRLPLLPPLSVGVELETCVLLLATEKAIQQVVLARCVRSRKTDVAIMPREDKMQFSCWKNIVRTKLWDNPN